MRYEEISQVLVRAINIDILTDIREKLRDRKKRGLYLCAVWVTIKATNTLIWFYTMARYRNITYCLFLTQADFISFYVTDVPRSNKVHRQMPSIDRCSRNPDMFHSKPFHLKRQTGGRKASLECPSRTHLPRSPNKRRSAAVRWGFWRG